MKVSNPLTIVAIFAGVAEIFAAGALVALPLEIQSIFVYFVMLFPLIIVLAFFSVLALKPHALYAPSDYNNEEHFLKLNSIETTIAKATEEAMRDVSAKGQNIDPQAFSRKVAEYTVDQLSSSFNKKLYRYLKDHPNEAFTASGLGHILVASRNSVISSLSCLEAVDLVIKGKDGDATIWQIKQ